MKSPTELSSITILNDYFEQLLSLNEEEKALVKKVFSPKLYRKKQYVLQEGNVCMHMCFVVKGCLRMYKIDDSGNTHIIQFASENYWMVDLASFYSEKPSDLTIDALEDTVVFQIKFADLVELYTKAPKFHRIFRVLIENSHVSLQKRLLQLISSTGEQRYHYFIETYPHLVNRLTQTQIASFLGITPEFLSRLRGKKSRSKS